MGYTNYYITIDQPDQPHEDLIMNHLQWMNGEWSASWGFLIGLRVN
jgi:hypothetical protein